MSEEQVETRPATPDEIKSGIELKPGHKTIVVIEKKGEAPEQEPPPPPALKKERK
jgi:hypothetical protein